MPPLEGTKRTQNTDKTGQSKRDRISPMFSMGSDRDGRPPDEGYIATRTRNEKKDTAPRDHLGVVAQKRRRDADTTNLHSKHTPWEDGYWLWFPDSLQIDPLLQIAFVLPLWVCNFEEKTQCSEEEHGKAMVYSRRGTTKTPKEDMDHAPLPFCSSTTGGPLWSA